MRTTTVMLAAVLLSIAAYVYAADSEKTEPAATDSRYPVKVAPGEAVHQKEEMRRNLVALRNALDSLAESDFEGVENAVKRLGHPGPLAKRPGVSTGVFADLERQFERSVDASAAAAHSGNSKATLHALANTMGYCQSCHAAFRQNVEAPAATEPEKK